jgi:hypothetical protein
MQPDFEKANEIYFRLGIIYKQQQKYQQSLEVSRLNREARVTQTANCFQCFRYIVSVPPTPLTEEDIWFQIGHVHEQQKDVNQLISSYSYPILTTVLVRQCKIGLPTCARPRSEACKGPPAAWLAASPAKQQLQQPGASY